MASACGLAGAPQERHSRNDVMLETPGFVGAPRSVLVPADDSVVARYCSTLGVSSAPAVDPHARAWLALGLAAGGLLLSARRVPPSGPHRLRGGRLDR